MAAWAALLLLGLLWTTTAHKNHGHNHVKHIRLGHRIRMAASYLAQSCSEHGRFRYIARANGMEHPEAGQYDMVRHAWVVSTLAQYALYEPSLDSHASRAADDRPAEVEAPLLRSTNLLIKSLHPGANASVAAPGRLLGALALWAPIDPAAEAARAEAARAEAEARAPARSTLRDVDSRVLPGPARMVAPQRTAHGRARAAFVREKLRSALAGERARALRAAAGPTPAHPPPPPPLPYKVDTSRPSLRTNCTRLGPARDPEPRDPGLTIRFWTFKLCLFTPPTPLSGSTRTCQATRTTRRHRGSAARGGARGSRVPRWRSLRCATQTPRSAGVCWTDACCAPSAIFSLRCRCAYRGSVQ